MTVSKQEIIDLALRYCSPEEVGDFPVEHDLFCLLTRVIPGNRILKEDEGWTFGGYGICAGYSYDEEAVPRGKWIWMYYTSLASFPPSRQTFKLQPPHIIKGMFHSTDRSQEFRIMKIVTTPETDTLKEPKPSASDSTPDSAVHKHDEKIIAFRKKASH